MASGLRLATRGSQLAQAQAALAVDALVRCGVGVVETVVIRALGDREADTPVQQLPGQGWFTTALELAVVEGRADAAIHSAKDLPSQLGDGLGVAAFLERGDCRDGLVTRDGRGLAALGAGARVGTGSARRVALLHALRPDLVAVPIRGNVDTRLVKLEAGEVDALLLACAGLDRIGASDRIVERLDPRVFVPAPCQGAIALETPLTGRVAEACAPADHPPTRAAAAAERAVLAALGGGCLLPLGAWARVEGGRLVLTASLEVGGRLRRTEMGGDPGAPEELGGQVAAGLR